MRSSNTLSVFISSASLKPTLFKGLCLLEALLIPYSNSYKSLNTILASILFKLLISNNLSTINTLGSTFIPNLTLPIDLLLSVSSDSLAVE